jgi:hypothetical protein
MKRRAIPGALDRVLAAAGAELVRDQDNVFKIVPKRNRRGPGLQKAAVLAAAQGAPLLK